MSPVETALKEFIRETIAEELSKAAATEPDLISLDEAAETCGCSKDVIEGLIGKADENGFPVIRLGQRTVKVDRTRLVPWLNAGGLRSRSGGDSKVRSMADWRDAA